MNQIITAKFGGTSLASRDSLDKVLGIIDEDPNRRAIVVSAPGKRDPSDTKVTDMLIELSKRNSQELAEKIIDRYNFFDLSDGNRILNELQIELFKRFNSNLDPAARLDSLKAFGEEAMARYLASIPALNFTYVDPKTNIRVTPEFGKAKVLQITEELLRKTISDSKARYVIPGFFGHTEDGRIATFHRGGSDLTGSIVAAAINAKVYENWTDTDGVYDADPRIIKNPNKINELTYIELRNLSCGGFSVLQHEAVQPVQEKSIPIHIRNTFDKSKIGTYIVTDRIFDSNKPVVGIAYQDCCAFNVEKTGLHDITGIVHDLTAVLKDNGKSLEFLSMAIDDVSFIVKQDSFYEKKDGVNELKVSEVEILKNGFKEVLPGARVGFKQDLGAIMVAGHGIQDHIGILADTALVLKENGINIKFVSQGDLQRSIVYGVEKKDGHRALNALYDKFLR